MKSIFEEMIETSKNDVPKSMQKSQPAPVTSYLEDELKPHYTAWKEQPSPKTTASLLRAVDPILQTGLRTYGGSSAESPLLKSRAKLLAINAIGRYDPSKSKLRSHLLVNLQGLNRERANEESIISVPERMRLAKFKLNTASQDLIDRLGREPSDFELADHTGIPTAHIAKLRKYDRVLAESQLEAGGDDEDSTFSPAVLDRKGNQTWLRFVYQDLDNYDRVILERTAGLHGKEVLPKQKIAAILGISPSAVSQRLSRIQKLLDTQDVTGNLL